MKKVERNNDKAGIIFLFTLISVVFFIDIYIELSRIYPTSAADKKIQTNYFPSGNIELLLSGEDSKSIADTYFMPRGYDPNSNAQSSLKLSLFFYLMAAFSFYYSCIFKGSAKNKTILSSYISFVNTGQLSHSSPRSPPEFI
jgi:hypothetical protein